MAVTHRAGKFAILLHADVAGSTSLVQQDEHLAHERIQTTFRRFGDTITRYHGRVRELRGDALLAEFERASDAVTAALVFQVDQATHNEHIEDDIRPSVRVGIAMGEVVFADRTVTGAGVVLAQRMEQLAEPGGVCITAAVHESLPQRMPFEQQNLGEQEVKGFDEPVRTYTVRLQQGAAPPGPAELSREGPGSLVRGLIVAAIVALICGGGLLAWYQPWAPDVEAASLERMAHPLPDKPSIAVLPFDNLSGDPGQDILVDGFTENIINSLAQLPGLFVIARNSTFTYKGKPVKVQQVAEDLGVQYVLEGSVRRSADQIRITTQLIDALSGHHLWANTYDRDVTDIFAIQDEITLGILRELQIELTEGGVARRQDSDSDNLEAYLMVWNGLSLYRNFNRDDNARARELSKRALELDPAFARAAVMIGWTHQMDGRFGWSQSRNQSYEEGAVWARKALEIDAGAAGQALLSNVYLVQRDFDKAIEAGEKSIDLAPSSSTYYANTALATYYAGDFERTVTLTKEAMRLHPFYPAWYAYRIGVAYRMLGRYEEAVAALREFYDRIPKPNMIVLTALASTYSMMGDMDNARAIVNETLELYPDASVEQAAKMHYFKHPEHLERILEALRQAGLPEQSPSD